MNFLKDKKAIITGATSGIGLATANLFARECAELILVGRDAEKGKAVEEAILNDGGKARFVPCDVSDESSVKELAKFVGEYWNGIDILFNNAGIFLPSEEIEDMPYENWKRTFKVNIDGFFYVTRNLKRYIFENRGTIINNASVAGMHSYVKGRSYAYSASKAAVIQFTRQMAKNYAADGVRVNCICPGIIETPMLGKTNREEYSKRVPLGYIGHPEDVAKVVLFLASDLASYVTGAVIPVGGGVEL